MYDASRLLRLVRSEGQRVRGPEGHRAEGMASMELYCDTGAEML
jgi:hypothetical protein